MAERDENFLPTLVILKKCMNQNKSPVIHKSGSSGRSKKMSFSV